jgi:hypothetical protein
LFRAEVLTKVIGKNLKHVRVFEEHEGDSGEDVVPCVRHHSWTQAASLDREYAEKRAIQGDGDHAACSFVSVRDAEEERGGQDSNPEFAAGARKLLQQVAAEGKFLADAGGDAEYHP